MSELDEATVRSQVESALGTLQDNALGLHLAENGIYSVDGCWWAVLDVESDPPEQSILREAVTQIEQSMEVADAKSAGLGVHAAWLIDKGNAERVETRP